MPTMTLYRNFLRLALTGTAVDLDSDTIKCALTTSTYTPNFDTHDFFDDVTNEVSGTGYSAGGATLASVAVTYTAANSWATAWAAATTYAAGDIVRPVSGNGYVYRAQGAGASHASTEPTWPTVIGDEVADNAVTWTCVGKGVVMIDANDASWASSTITARRAVVYDATPGSAATRPLICCLEFDADVSTTNGTFLIQWDSQGLILIPIA